MWEEKGRGIRSGAEEKGELEEVIKRIREIDNLGDGLRVADFAKEGGYADKIAKGLKKELNPTQLRKFFDAVREIENKLEMGKWDDASDKFYLLQPQLAYAVGREVVPPKFYELMKASLSKIDRGTDEEKKRSFKRFRQFLEAIVAYQKYYQKVGAR